MESLAWVARMERGQEEGGGQLPYLSHKGMFNVKTVMVFVPLWLVCYTAVFSVVTQERCVTTLKTAV